MLYEKETVKEQIKAGFTYHIIDTPPTSEVSSEDSNSEESDSDATWIEEELYEEVEAVLVR